MKRKYSFRGDFNDDKACDTLLPQMSSSIIGRWTNPDEKNRNWLHFKDIGDYNWISNPREDIAMRLISHRVLKKCTCVFITARRSSTLYQALKEIYVKSFWLYTVIERRKKKRKQRKNWKKKGKKGKTERKHVHICRHTHTHHACARAYDVYVCADIINNVE